MTTQNRNYARSIAASIEGQQSKLLRKGALSDWRFSQIRQRHLWSDYHFTIAGAASAIQLVGGTPQIRAGDYTLFVTLQNQNGQGLPAGFTMTPQDTNNLGSGRVPDDQNFSFWELGVTIEPERQDVVAGSTAGAVSLGNPHPDDVDRILTEGVLQVQYLTNKVPLGHLKDFAQSGGAVMATRSLLSYTGAAALVGAQVDGGLNEGNTAPNVSERVGRSATNSGNGWPNPGTRRKLDIPIFLAATQTYAFVVTFARPVTLRSRLNGGTGCFSLRIDGWVVESFRDAG